MTMTSIEAADVAVARAVAPVEETRLGRAIGGLGVLGDQSPMRMLCVATFGLALVRGDGRLGGTAVRMLAAHSLATLFKSIVKHRVDRTRPSLLIERGEYEAGAGGGDDHDRTSFPSGHTAGVTAIAAVVGRAYPAARLPSGGAALAIAVLQVPRRAHYVSDVLAGALIGLAAEGVVAVLWPQTLGTGTKGVHRPY